MPSFQVLIRYSFPFNPERRMFRATAQNIWTRSERLEVYCKGKILLGPALNDAKAEIRDRLLKLFNYKSLLGQPITRYRLNYVAAMPEGYLNEKDCDHTKDNIPMRQLSAAYGNQVSDDWLKATDDRFKIIHPESRPEHKLTHLKRGDKSFYPFCKSEYNPTFDYENCL